MPWTCQIQAERSIEEDGKARNLVQRCQEAKVILSLASGIVSYSFDVFLSDCWLYNVLCTLISTISSISTTSSLNLYVLQTSTNIYTSFSDFVGIRWSAMEEACAPSWGATFLLGTAPTTGTITRSEYLVLVMSSSATSAQIFQYRGWAWPIYSA